MVLACAMSGKADAVVTGDRDLLVMGTWRGVVILSPRQLLSRLEI
jgi:predicted nucleic acid-binding protein